MKDPEADILGRLMGTAGDNEMVASFVGGISEDLDSMTVDETVEWMYKLFFRERPIVEETVQEDYLPTIIYEPDSKLDGTGIYFTFLFIALAELIYIKERVRINRFLKRRLVNIRNLKKRINQEV